MVTAQQAVEQLGGIARGTQLSAFGLSRTRLDTAVRCGEVARLRPGVFASTRASEDVIVAAEHGGALTCAAALRHHGIWVLTDDDTPHVWLGTAGRVHHDACQCIPHYTPGKMRLGVAPIPQALVHAYRCHGDEFFFCAFESAWQQRAITAAERQWVRAELPASARWLVDFAQNTSESGLESLLRLRLHLVGITLEAQVHISGVGRVDFVIDGCVLLEADGVENHADAQKRHKDLVRDAAASALGYESLRFDYAQIVHDWPTVLAAIVAAVARARA